MEKLYLNGTILTMETPETAEAVLTRDGKIAAVGSQADLEAMAPSAEKVDLQGKTMMPAFLDTHGHLSGVAQECLQISLEECTTREEAAEKIHRQMEIRHIPEGEWVIASGYNPYLLREQLFPTLRMLDKIAPRNPLFLQYKSGQSGCINTAAIERLGLTADIPDPENGRYGRENGILTGQLDGMAFFQCQSRIPQPSLKELRGAYRRAMELYASYGVTTVQDGWMSDQMIPIYKNLLGEDFWKLDVVGYAHPEIACKMEDAFPESVEKYDRHFRLGGYEVVLDSSLQGRTAWVQRPYEEDENYCGYALMSNSLLEEAAEAAGARKMQFLAHCTGDAAAEQFLNAVRDMAQMGYPLVRPVMIHAQMLNPSQLERMKELGVIPSFFSSNLRYWGDWNLENLGYSRAARLNPAGSAWKLGLPFTLHQDAPILEPNLLEAVSSAVCRTTPKGMVLGREECLPVYEALKAVTINAAFQYREEERKGSIRPGKQADFVVLDANPLETEPEQIAEIKVLRTIKDDETVYSA